MANQVDFKIAPSDQFSVYSPSTRSEKTITYFTLLSKLRGDILTVSSQDDPNNIVSAYYSNAGGVQTLHLVKADGSEVTASTSPSSGSVSGTVNYVAKFDTTTSVGDSQIFDDGTNVGIGTTTMTHKLQLGTGGVFADYYQLDTSYTNGFVQGNLSWSIDTETLTVGLNSGLKLNVGQDDMWYVKNQTGSTINKGTAVYASGTLGASGRITVAPMIADGTIAAKFFLGITAENIDDGEDGYVMAKGKIRQISTLSYNEGDVLWVSPTVAGGLTPTEPTAPSLKLPVAFVVYKASNGVIAVRATTGTRIADASDVDYTGALDNSFLVYNSTSGVWEDEVVGIFKTVTNGTTPITASSYTDTLTITGTSPVTVTNTALSKTVNISVSNGNLSEVTSSVLTITGGTGAVLGSGTTIRVSQANSTTSGYLSSADWNTFNSKSGAAFKTISVAGQSNIVADAADDTLTIVAGTGVTLTTNATTDTLTITNAAPDQTVVLTAGTGITTSGTYPNFTITNSAPDQTVALTAGTGISVTGTYPNFTITNTSTSSGGTVTNVSALTIGTAGTDLSSTVVNSTTTPVITLNVPTASATKRGALSSADWSTFNGKQNAITLTTTGTSGAATLVGATLNIPQYTDQFTGTVTSVNLTAGDRIEVSGGPITTSGSITVTHGTASGADFTTAQDFEARVIADGGTFEALGEVAIAIGSLEDAASPSSTDYNDGFVLQNIAIDTYGHVLGVGATNLDDRYAQVAFKNIAVSGQSTVVADSNNDTLTLAAGTGISITTNASTDTVTITNTAVTSISCFSAYSSTGITLASDGTAYDLTLDVETVKDATVFSHSTSVNSDEVTVLSAGTYEISYSGTLYNSNSDPDSAAAVVFELYKNTTAIDPLNTAQTVSHVNVDNYNYINQVANSYILTLAANDVIKLSVTANYQAVGPHSPAVIFGYVAGAKNNVTIKKIG